MASMTVDRRGFVAGTVATCALGAAAVKSAGAEQVDEGSREIAETFECDIVIAGGGLSGLAAAVRASDDGASVIVLEKLGILGGNGSYTDGPSGFDTRWSRAAGIDYDYRDAAIEDQHMFNFIPNIHYYLDMAKASSDNLEF